MVTHTLDVASHKEDTADAQHTDVFRIYQKLSKGSQGFLRRISLTLTRTLDFVVRPMSDDGNDMLFPQQPVFSLRKNAEQAHETETVFTPLLPEL